MAKIDNKKMWEAIEKLLDVADAIKTSLSKQGLQWNGKEIVSIESKLAPSEATKESDQELTELENKSQSILLDETINWDDEIRIQAAIAAMQGMLANSALVDSYRDYGISIEKSAVGYANTLIEELRKKG